MVNSFYSLLVDSEFAIFSSALKCADFDIRHTPDNGLALAKKIADLSILEQCEVAQSIKRLVVSSNYDPFISDAACICLFASQDFEELVSIAERSIKIYGCIRHNMARNFICSLICQARWEDLDSFSRTHRASLDKFSLNNWIALASRIRQGDVATVSNSLTNGLELRFLLSALNTSILATSLGHSQGELLESNELKILSRYISGGNVLDIGSLCGNHSIYFSKVCGAKKVVAIDSQSECCALTALNFRLNNINPESYSIINVTAGGQTPLSKIGSDHCFESGIYLDSRCEIYDLIKVDIDGGEVEFLRRSMEYFKKNKTTLMCEVTTKSASNVFNIMSSIGYSFAPLTNRVSTDGDNNYLFKYA